MAEMEFKYSSNQEYQVKAIESVTNLLRGQEFVSTRFTAGIAGGMLGEAPAAIGYSNGIHVSARQLADNLHSVQEEYCLPRTEALTDGRLRDFTVEMETGTGKTYVYSRTIYELNKRYGLTKFAIVVPSVAIREGVLKSFQSTRKHFATLYDRTPLDFFVYDSKDMGPVGNFATSSSIQVMIINIGAFNKAFDDSGDADRSNLFHRPSEKLPGGRSPQELVSMCNPVVIIDEPQSVDNTAKAKKAIRSLNPLLVLRYSATHKETYNMVYRLTPVDAYQQKLVKEICVDSVLAEADLNGSYVRLEGTQTDPFRAKLTIDVVDPRTASQKRKALSVKPGDDLFEKSGGNTDYEAGWLVTNISTAAGNEFVEFQNGKLLEKGETVGDVAADAVKRAQIRRTIENHLQRQVQLWPLGIKVLSLFFIDRVDKYRDYSREDLKGEYAQVFEEEYRAVASLSSWRERFDKAGIPLPDDPAPLHEGYFAEDKNHHFKDSSGNANTEADLNAFDLIMREREKLVSFPSEGDSPEDRRKKQVCFIFSHSALKEGWDNPNVFQICTLVETKDPLSKRQKIGRGLRLPVNQDGERCHDSEKNILTVIANESYDSFASGLQSELSKEGFKFGMLTPESFSNLVIETKDGTEKKLGFDGSAKVFEHLKDVGLVDSKRFITPELKEKAVAFNVPLPEKLTVYEEQVATVIVQKSEKLQIRDKQKEVTVELQKDVTEDPDFQELWERIRQRTRYEVIIDSDDLVKSCIKEVNQIEKVTRPMVISERASLDVAGSGVSATGTGTSIVSNDTGVTYDLPDPIAQLQDAVGLTRHTIKRILEGCDVFDQFPVDPATFLERVAVKINRAKNDLVSQGIKYTKLPESNWYTMEILDQGDVKAFIGQNAWAPEHLSKSLYNYVVYDSSTVEKPFAVELDQADEVKVFAKLPPSFVIDTPLGSYNPDWAYVQEIEGQQKVFFVVETKGGGNSNPTTRTSEQDKIDCARQHFKALGTDTVEYRLATTYHSTLSK